MTEQANQFRRLIVFLGTTALGVLAEMAGGPNPENGLIVASATCFGLCLPISMYMYLAIEFDERLGNFPYRQRNPKWWEQRFGFLAFLTLCSLYVVGICLLISFFSPRATWAFVIALFVLAIALAEGLIPRAVKGEPKDRNAQS